MINVMGENYYVDLDELDKCVQIGEVDHDSMETKVNIIKYEVIKMMIEVILDPGDTDGVDEVLGSKSSHYSIPFKLAFNTLLNKKIIKHY